MDDRQPSPFGAVVQRLLRRLRPDGSEALLAQRLYGEIAAHARTPAFYRDLGVPDTPEGRFEMVALHVALVVRRLRAAGTGGKALSQATFDLMFADMDESLRHIGVGDLSVGKYVKRLAGNFYARLAALDEALGAGDPGRLEPLLTTNVYHGAVSPSGAQLDALATYLVTTERDLTGQPDTALLEGRITFRQP